MTARGGADLRTVLRVHWAQMPAMHLGMTVGGLAAVPLLRAPRRSAGAGSVPAVS